MTDITARLRIIDELAAEAVREFAEFAAKHDARVVVRGALPHEYAEMRRHIAAIDRWLDLLAVTMDAL